MHLLLIEDKREDVDLIGAILERLQITYEPCYDPELAVSKLELNGFDALLVDHLMPKMNGLELLRDIQRRGYTQPAYMVTLLPETEMLELAQKYHVHLSGCAEKFDLAGSLSRLFRRSNG